MSLLIAAAALWLPPSLAPLHSHETQKLRWSLATILPLPIAFFEMAALGSIWAYLEPLGLAAGFSEQGAQSVVSLVLVMQVLGGLTAVWAVRRSPVAVTLALGAAALAAIAVGVHFTPAGAFVSFTLLFAAFGFAWLFLMPFQVALALRADPPGRVAVLISAAQLIGSAIGPLGASLVVNGDDASPVPFASLAFSRRYYSHCRRTQAVAECLREASGRARRLVVGGSAFPGHEVERPLRDGHSSKSGQRPEARELSSCVNVSGAVLPAP